jgi:hypothetical protein
MLGWWRDAWQWRRKVKLTMHRAYHFGYILGASPAPCYFVTITNASPKSDVTVTHVWLDLGKTKIHSINAERPLPVRLRYHEPWETWFFEDELPDDTVDIEWSARCQITPDDKVIRSRPRRNVPDAGMIPGG